MSHLNVPVFVPHQGCPHRCGFCNQRSISGAVKPPSPEAAAERFRQAARCLGDRTRDAELAFFGGSFTAIDPGYRRALLQAAQQAIWEYGFSGIRISTRPDCVDAPVLEDLRRYGVVAVELGVQSMDDRVLRESSRGHTAADAQTASRLIRQFGLELGHQMMTGLPGDTPAGALATADAIIALGPDTVRIYPTVVLENTALADLWRGGSYRPQTVDEAVALGARLLERFARADIRVIRLGLHDEPGLSDGILAGPHHPALGELCRSRLLLERVRGALDRRGILAGPVEIRVHPRAVSRLVGQHRANLRELERCGYRVTLLQDPRVDPDLPQAEPLQGNKGAACMQF